MEIYLTESVTFVMLILCSVLKRSSLMKSSFHFNVQNSFCVWPTGCPTKKHVLMGNPFDQPAKLFVFRAGSVDGKSVAHQVGGGARACEAGLFWKGAVSNYKQQQSLEILMDTSEWYTSKRGQLPKRLLVAFSVNIEIRSQLDWAWLDQKDLDRFQTMESWSNGQRWSE